MARIQQLQPSTFTLKILDDELSCMAMMHALGDEYKQAFHLVACPPH